MANTTNLNLVKPAGTDKALVSVINSNSDKIDAFAGTTNQGITALNSKIANVINVGIFTASGSSIETKITDSISRVTTGGVTVNFTANPSSSGTAYVSGFLYADKSYGGGYYIDTYREAYWYLVNGTLTITDLASNKLNNYSGTHTIGLLNDTGFISLEFRNTNASGMFTRLNIFDTGKVTISRYANGAWQTEATLRNAD